MFSPKIFRVCHAPITYPVAQRRSQIDDSGRMSKTLTNTKTHEFPTFRRGRGQEDRGGKYVFDGFPKNYFAYAKKTVDFTRQI